jgi:hypothetical protein
MDKGKHTRELLAASKPLIAKEIREPVGGAETTDRRAL